MTERVIEELSKLGNTHREVAQKLGVTPEAVRFWREGYAIPKPQNLAKFHAAGLDIFYIITGRRIEDILTRECRNCLHFNDCDSITCDFDCAACNHNTCGDCRDSSNWVWEGYANQH